MRKTHGKRRRTKGTSEEAENKECLNILRPGRARVEGRQGAIGDDVQDLSSEQLTQRRPKQRSDGETQDEQTDTEGDDLGAGVEGVKDLVDTA